MSRIEKLTESQVAQLVEWRDKWLEIGTSTEPTDRQAAELAVSEAYKAANLQPPRIKIWLRSPLEGAIGAALLANLPRSAQVRAQVGDQVGDQVRAQVRDQVGAQVRDQVWDQVRAQVGDQVGDQVRDQVGAQVRDQVWDQVRAQVRDQVWDQVRAQVRDQVGAQVRDQVWDQVRAQVRDQVGAQVRDQVRAQVRDQVRDQVGAQVRDQVRAQVRDQVWAQVRVQVGAQVGAQVWAQVRDQVGAQVRDQVWAQVGDQVWAQVGAQVWAQVRVQVGAQVGAQVGDQVRDQVWAQVGDQVRDQVWAQVRDQVGDQVRDQVWAQVYRCGYGAHDAGWLSFYDYFDRVVDLNCTQRLRPLGALAQSAGWWWPFAGAVILTERPVHLSRDVRNRLHGENRAAIEYADGWGVYAWHGVRVPKDIIVEPRSITPERIDNEQNAEIRRAMIELYGQEKYIKDSGAKLLDESGKGINRRRLWRKELAGDEPLVMVELVNSTPEPDRSRKTYFLRVPPNIKTAKAAVSWTFGLDAVSYSPGVET